jgi:hypothetical protein
MAKMYENFVHLVSRLQADDPAAIESLVTLRLAL